MKNKYPKFKVSTITLLLLISGLVHGATLPSGPGASSGVSGISTSGNTMTINTNANKSIQNWSNFSVGSGGTVVINQPSNSSIMLNRVTGGTMSQVYGTIRSNGGVWLVNPQGIYFGPGSVVNAGSVLLSTLNITDSSFSSNGSYVFTPTGSSGAIGLDGSIQASSIVAIAPKITQASSGTLNATQEVHLLATDNAKLAIDASGLIVANLNQSTTQTILNTQGAIRTVNGGIELTAIGHAMAAEALITVGGIVLTEGRNSNININAPHGSYLIYGAVRPGPGGRLIINHQYGDDAENAADKKQVAQLAGRMGSESEKNSMGSGLITDASERQLSKSESGSNSEGSKFAENRESGDGRDDSNEGRRESRDGARKGKESNKGGRKEKGANTPAQAATNPTTNPAGNVPASNAASNSAASNGVNPAGNPVTPGNAGNNSANTPAQAATNPTTNPAGNVPASNAASNSAASNGVNPAGNPVTPGNAGNNSANTPAQAATNPTTNPAGNVPASNAASNSAASNGVNPAGNPVTPGNAGNNSANTPAQAATNPTTNPAGNVPASNAASNSAASNGVNPAGNPVTPGNAGNNSANTPAQAATNPTTNPAGNATSNILLLTKEQIPYVNSQFVTLKPGSQPIIEKGYSIKPQLNNVDIKPLRTVDPVYRAPGPVIGTSSFNINVRGANLPYQVSTSENGLQIKPLSETAARYAENNRSTVLKGAVNNAVDNLSATPGTFRTIYMNFN